MLLSLTSYSSITQTLEIKNATLINVGDGAIGTLTFADNIRYNNGTSVINLNPFGGTAAPPDTQTL